ncbi:Cyanidin 3-O-rutinoside 5-O-glucosyltransferase [Apostasia shenzhenica]|uniref:Glycosyltransferase n=1 Tax=Apostasia shenzhenica TaxID=1088818 RepID=A0A2I0A296_9ASPA|nr:Cyanidin 3-O-rutinoside 5-O-glucosyltransferase [Apostasia shenzhenica]
MDRRHHFLLVSLSGQGQINPTRQLARRLARLAGARVTLANPLFSHRRLFPTSAAVAGQPDDSTEEEPLNPDGTGIISYAPYSDGYDEGFNPLAGDGYRYMSDLKSFGSRTIAALVRAFAAGGRPVTCLLYNIILVWVTDVAHDHGIPAVLHWIQSASVFSIYYHYFNDHRSFNLAACAANPNSSNTIELPGLPPLRPDKDLPSILAKPSPYRSTVKDIFTELDKSEKSRLLVNSFYDLDAQAIKEISRLWEIIFVGPMMENNFISPATGMGGGDYMDWLQKQQERSVVYVAFGSLTVLTARQTEEVARGLKKSGRPYLWVMRQEGRAEEAEDGNGMVVEWCSQVGVLGHRAVGCFVTHCGWNSMLEAVGSGVPMVMMPQWMDQTTNAALAEAVWGVGVRAEAAGDGGLVEAEEIQRCVETVMGDGERGREVRRRAAVWKEKAGEAAARDGPAERNLKGFLDGF